MSSEFEAGFRKTIEQLKHDESALEEMLRNKLQLEEEMNVLRIEFELSSKIRQSMHREEPQSPANSNANSQSAQQNNEDNAPLSSNEEILQILERNFEQRSQIAELKAKVNVLKGQVNTLAADRINAAMFLPPSGPDSLQQQQQQAAQAELLKAQQDRIDVLKDIISRRESTIDGLNTKLENIQLYGNKPSTNNQPSNKGPNNSSTNKAPTTIPLPSPPAEQAASSTMYLEKQIERLRIDVFSGKEREAHLTELNSKLRRENQENINLVNELKLSIGRVKSGQQASDSLIEAQNKFKQLEKENMNLIAQINDFNSKQVILLTQNTVRVRKEEKIKQNLATDNFNKMIEQLKAENQILVDEMNEIFEREKNELKAKVILQEKESEMLKEKLTETIKHYSEKLEHQKNEIEREMYRQMEELKAEIALERQERQKEGHIIMDENKKFREALIKKSVKDARYEVLEELTMQRQEIQEWEYKYSQLNEKLKKQHKSQMATLLTSYETQITGIRTSHHSAQNTLVETITALDSEKHSLNAKIAAFELTQSQHNLPRELRPNAGSIAAYSQLKTFSMAESQILLSSDPAVMEQMVNESNDIEFLRRTNIALIKNTEELKAKSEGALSKHRQEVQNLCRDMKEMKGKVEEWYQEKLDEIVQQQQDFVVNMKRKTNLLKQSHSDIIKQLKGELAQMCLLVEERPSKKEDLVRILALEEELNASIIQIQRLKQTLQNTQKNNEVFRATASTIHSITSNMTRDNTSPKFSLSSIPGNQNTQTNSSATTNSTNHMHTTTSYTSDQKPHSNQQHTRPDSAPYRETTMTSPSRRSLNNYTTTTTVEEINHHEFSPYTGILVRKPKRSTRSSRKNSISSNGNRCRTAADETLVSHTNSRDNSIVTSPDRGDRSIMNGARGTPSGSSSNNSALGMYSSVNNSHHNSFSAGINLNNSGIYSSDKAHPLRLSANSNKAATPIIATYTTDFHTVFADPTSILKNTFLKRAIKTINSQTLPSTQQTPTSSSKYPETPKKAAYTSEYTPIKSLIKDPEQLLHHQLQQQQQKTASIQRYSKQVPRSKDSPSKPLMQLHQQQSQTPQNRSRAKSSLGFNG